jgi:oxygen-dependent protoporphyrinogen oxidase
VFVKGTDLFNKLVDPFVSGIYAGDAKKLSMSAALSKVYALERYARVRGLLAGGLAKVVDAMSESYDTQSRDADLPKVSSATLGTLKHGLQQIGTRVGEILGTNRIYLSHNLVDIEHRDSYWLLRFVNHATHKLVEMETESLLLTIPAASAAKLLSKTLLSSGSTDSGGGDDSSSSSTMETLRKISGIRYPPVVSVASAYPNDCFKEPLRGFGHLIPRSENIRTLGTIWASSLFPGRAPSGFSTLVSMVGGSHDMGVATMTRDEVLRIVHQDTQRVLLKPGAPLPIVLGVRLWPNAVPQYEMEHSQVTKDFTADVSKHRGLYVGGNYIGGVSLPDCVANSRVLANKVFKYLQS